MILLDTSALIEYSNATESAVDRRVVELIESDVVVFVTEPVEMEFLAGAKTSVKEDAARDTVAAFDLLAFEAIGDFERAALIYRSCRAQGVTPRNLIDCMIASVAMRNDAVVLAADVDFARIASVVDLKLDPATPRE